MPDIQNIVFPTDFSVNAEHALPYALDIARKTTAKFSLLHVYDLPWNAHEKEDESIVKVREDARNEIMNNLRHIIEINQLSDHPHRSYVREGGVPQNILDIIKQENADLVIMGTKGASAEKGIFMGSVTKNILQNATCPVLAIPESASFKGISNIVYATDLQFDETILVEYLVNFAALYKASIHVLHVEHDKGRKAWNRKKLQKIIAQTAYPNIEFNDILLNDVEEGIEQFAGSVGADLIAMTTYTTTLFDRIFGKSLTKEMLLHTSIPLLAFNRKKFSRIFV